METINSLIKQGHINFTDQTIRLEGVEPGTKHFEELTFKCREVFCNDIMDSLNDLQDINIPNDYGVDLKGIKGGVLSLNTPVDSGEFFEGSLVFSWIENYDKLPLESRNIKRGVHSTPGKSGFPEIIPDYTYYIEEVRRLIEIKTIDIVKG